MPIDEHGHELHHKGRYVAFKNELPGEGVSRVLYDGEIPYNSDFAVLDTGVVLRDGVEYEVVVTALSGTSGGTASVANIPVLDFILADGTEMGIMQVMTNSTAILNGIYQFRYQEHVRATDPDKLVMTSFPTSGSAVGVVSYTGTVDSEIDSATGSPPMTVGPLTDSNLRRVVDRTQAPATIGLHANGTPNCDVVLMVKVMARGSEPPGRR